MTLNRRQFSAMLALASVGTMMNVRIAHAALPTHKRLIFIIQRGAADGLATLIPTGDPDVVRQRSVLVAPDAVKLDAMFALHPALAETAKLYAAKQALFAHAVASSYRERSHFDGQNILETGGLAAYAAKDGWMNRVIGLFGRDTPKAIALAPTVATALRGPNPASSYAASALPDASEDLVQRTAALYEADPALHAAFSQALANRATVGALANGGQNGTAIGALAAKLMTGPEAARLVMIEATGWDTHNQQAGRLTTQLKNLDAIIASLKGGLGAEWADTLVLVATEFGRTVAVNGTGGTDHGTASAAMLLGGGVKGGRVLADWPGLSQSALYEGRDLKPTASLESLITSAVATHFALDPVQTARAIYPAHKGLRPMVGLA